MKWQAEYKNLEFRKYVIKKDPFVGFYLYVYEGNKCKYDYLQDSMEETIEFAFEEFGVPKNAWKEID